MASGFDKHMLKDEKYLIKIAGISPEVFKCFAVQFMSEAGVDIKRMIKVLLTNYDVLCQELN